MKNNSYNNLLAVYMLFDLYKLSKEKLIVQKHTNKRMEIKVKKSN